MNIGELVCGFLYALSFSGSSYHARMRPASTKSNAIPEKSHWEKRNDVGRKFISWKQKIMRGTAKTRNLERIQNEELGILRNRSMQKAQKSLTQPPAAGKPEILFSTCLRYACGEAQRKLAYTEQKRYRPLRPLTDVSTQAVCAAKCHATALRLCLLAISKMR